MQLRYRSSSRHFAVAAALMLFSPLIPAQKVGGCPAIPIPPADLSMSLAPDSGQSVYREGEIIALTVRYSTKTGGKYLLSNRSYDRSGRLDGIEVLCIEPDGGKDPLADYFNSYQAFLGGGLSSNQDLRRSPAIKIELNEWRSLPPGSYKISIVGNRINSGTEKDLSSWGNDPIPLRSNPITIRVEKAGLSWQTMQLSDAVKALDSPNTTENQKRHAIRVLRFLGSEDATRELVRRFMTGPQELLWDSKAGLYGSPFRPTAILEMKAALNTTRGHVREEFVDTLVNLELQSDSRYRPSQTDHKNDEVRARAFNAFEGERTRRAARYIADAARGKLR